MLNAIIGTKFNQTQKFTDKGERLPITVINAGPCLVMQIKTIEKDGYDAIQLGLGSKKEINTTKPTLGRIKKAGVKINPRFFREIELNQADLGENLKLGSEIKVNEVFQIGDLVDVIGTSKGKGFAGAVKRHHFKGGPRTHGQSDRERAPGSVGSSTTPGRVLRGKRMAGHMGSDKVTVKNLSVIDINPENNQLILKGLVPGGKNGLLMITKVSK